MASIVTLPFTAPKDGILYLYGDPISGGSFYAYYEIKNSKGDNVFSGASAHSDLYTLGGWATNVHMHEITLKKGDTITALSIGGDTTSYIYSFR